MNQTVKENQNKEGDQEEPQTEGKPWFPRGSVKGMQDFLPERARKKKYIEQVCKDVFVSYGFQPLETPALEYLETLTKKGGAGEAIKEEIFAFKDKADREVGLRFDLTVPLARVAAANSTSTVLPFKRYAIERVYRYDKPGEKRYREFTQADVDIIGSSNLLCELECLGVAVNVCQKLKIEFEVIVNSRKLLESLALACGIEKESVMDCFRSIDKLDKIGKEGVEKELKEKGLNTEILKWCAEKDLNKVKKFLEGKKGNLDGINELEQLLNLCKKAQLEKFVKLDFSLARGLGYYTGMVFEVKTKKGPSIAGGGRYDQLISVLGGQDLKACGISFGIDRMLDVIENELEVELETQVFVMPFKPEFELNALDIAQQLRNLNVRVEMDLMSRNLKKNLEYANKQKVPYIIVIGENEVKAKECKLKNMDTRKETLIKFTELNKVREVIEKSRLER